MDTEEFRRAGKQMVDYIADYHSTVAQRRVVHDVTPGYMRSLVPQTPPETGQPWDAVMHDVDRVVMPGMSHWQSPHFHGWFAGGGSYPSLMGDMLCDALGCIGLSWEASPACTELEIISTDWLGQMLGLPDVFLHCKPGPGGGVIQTAASEAVVLCVLAAKAKKIAEVRQTSPEMTPTDIAARLVCYSSEQANSSVHRSALLAMVKMRLLETDDSLSLRGETLERAIADDKEQGLIPFFVCATLGTTGTCAFDNISELGPVCTETDVWLHVDAAYAGAAFVCPEYRHLIEGVEHAQTFNMNPHKWMLVNFDLSVLWIQDRNNLVNTFEVNPIYLQHRNDNGDILDFRHWQIPLGRRFRSLKLWFVIKSYGVSGIQRYIRNHIERAKDFAELIEADDRFETAAPVAMGLVCFRLKGSNELNKSLHEDINSEGKVFIVPGSINTDSGEKYFLRFAIVPERVTKEDVFISYRIISNCANEVLKREESQRG